MSSIELASPPPPQTYLEALPTLDPGDSQALEHLIMGYIDPHVPDPPGDQWATTRDTDEAQGVRVPFTAAELAVIDPGRAAMRAIITEGARGSGAPRDFWIQSPFFPTTASALSKRGVSLWGLFAAAKLAGEMPATVVGTAWQLTPAELRHFDTIRELPDKWLAVVG